MKSVLVVGLGKTGQSVLAYCHRMGWRPIAFDTRDNVPDKAAIALCWPQLPIHLGDLPDSVLSEIERLIVSPGVDLNHPVIVAARARKLPIVGDIELFAAAAAAPIIAITGSNGKSTVTSLVTEMIKAAGRCAQIGGNIGIPVLDLLEKPLPDYYVLELSSFQLELTEHLQAFVAVVLNISPDHLDRHGSVAAYQAAKERVYRDCRHAVVNREMQYQTSFKQVTSFGLDPAAPPHYGLMQHDGEYHLAQGLVRLLPIKEISPGLSGRHNIENALAALAIVAPLHLPLAPMLKILRSFAGLPHRCQRVRTLNDVTWFNDSKGTNIGATMAALKGLGALCPGKLILLLGGQGKGADFTELRPDIERYVRAVIVFGQDAPLIAKALNGLPLHEVKDFHGVIETAQHLAQEGDYVLLSPACASLDMFKNYEHRGEVFTDLVQHLNS